MESHDTQYMSGNPVLSAHILRGTIIILLSNSEKTNIFPLLTPLQLKMRMNDGQTSPGSLTCPLVVIGARLQSVECPKLNKSAKEMVL